MDDLAKNAKLWWHINGANAGGCLTTLGVTSLILFFVLMLLWPIGQSTAVRGKLVEFGMSETEMGSYRVAYVVADGVRDRVRLYPSDRCAVGNNVDVRIVRRLWGKSVVRGRASQLCSS